MAKDKQITNYRRMVGQAIKHDRAVVSMPYVRINAAKSMSKSQRAHEPEFINSAMKRVPIAKYLSTHRKETNLH